jgi:hypothetical protein
MPFSLFEIPNIMGVVIKCSRCSSKIYCSYDYPVSTSSIMFLEASAAISGEANVRSGFMVDPL